MTITENEDDDDRPLHDNDLMEWGHYVDTPLGEVPDDYWLWFLRQKWCDKWPRYVTYANYVLEEDD